MNALFIVAIALLFSVGCASAGRMAAADINWSRRDDKQQLQASVDRLEAVVRAEPENADALTKLSRALLASACCRSRN